MSTHAETTGDSPVTEGENNMAEGCTNCHTLEHEIEKKDTEISRMAEDLQEAATALRQPQPNPGHQDILELIDCPNCGPPALTAFEDKGGAVLAPGKVKKQLVKYVRENFPIFEKGIEIP